MKFNVLLEKMLNNVATSATAEKNNNAYEKFMGLVRNEPTRAFYSFKDVAAANEFAAIETLLITEALIRSEDVNERKKYHEIVKNVVLKNGKIRIFSSSSPSGKGLNMLTGIAAILRFPLVLTEDENIEDVKEKSTGLNLQLRTDGTHDKHQCKIPRKIHCKPKLDDDEEFYNSHRSRTVGGYTDDWEEEEEEETDYEVPVPRSHMTLGDCIFNKR